jgi:hypothetical protein
LRQWGLSACALISAGALQITGDLGNGPVHVTSPWVLLGGRVAYDLMFSERIGAGLWGELQAVLTRTTLKSVDKELWVTPPLAGGFGLRLVLRFL